MSTTHEAGSGAQDDVLEQTVRSTLTARGSRTAADRARSSALLRHDDRRWIAGVCEAIARAIGVPVRLIRTTAVVLALLGVGVPAYLLAMLLVPRTSRARTVTPGAEARRDVRGEATRAEPGDVGVEVPLVAMAAGKVRLGDVAALLALLPSVLIGLWWILAVLAHAAAMTAVLVALTVVLLALLALATHRAGQARRAMILALLARRAGVADDEALETFLLEQQRRAPRAWDRLAHGDASEILDAGNGAETGAAGLGAAPAGVPGEPAEAATPGRPIGGARRPGALAPSGRLVIAVLAGMLATCALVTLALNLDPGLLPGVADARLLPQIGRVGAGCAMAAVLAAIVLIALGWRGRRSVVLALVGLLAVSGAGLAGTWVRLTVDPQAEPYVISMDGVEHEDHHWCPRGPGAWDRPVVIDLSDVATEDVERLREQRTASGADGGTSVFIDCSPQVGSITVLMPADPALVAVSLHTWNRSVEARERDSDPVVGVYGSLAVGDIAVVEHPDTATEG